MLKHATKQFLALTRGHLHRLGGGGRCLMALALFGLMLLNPRAGLAQSKMYWTDGGNAKIQRANLDGTSGEDLVSGLGYPFGIALDVAGGKMYWVTFSGGKIQRANLDGTSVEDLVTGVDRPAYIALDVAAGKMYWTEDGGDKIQRANLDGTSVEAIVTGTGTVQGIDLDVAAGKMYWKEADNSKIRRANLDGTSAEDLVTGVSGYGGIALDVAAGKMYWTNSSAAKIQRANLDGTSVEDLVTTGLGFPFGIALDVAVGKIYWTDIGTATIQRANLDGTSVENIVTGLIEPLDIALDVVAVMPPTITCPANITVPNAPGQCEQSVEFSVTATGDPAPTVEYTVGATVITSPYTFPAGTTTVNCTATNSVGSASCSFTVTVEDVEDPSITCPANMLVRPTSLGGAVVTYAAPVATDNCGATVTQTAGLASGSQFPLGTTTNTFEATDAAGNTAICSFTVEVIDPHCTPKKVYVCHNGKTLCVSENAMPAHLAHGDLLGPCELGKAGADMTEAELPTQFTLEQNYPNPFNPETEIRFALPEAGQVTVKIFSTTGQEIRTLANAPFQAGHQTLRWDGRDQSGNAVAAGVYLYQITATGENGEVKFSATKRMAFVK